MPSDSASRMISSSDFFMSSIVIGCPDQAQRPLDHEGPGVQAAEDADRVAVDDRVRGERVGADGLPPDRTGRAPSLEALDECAALEGILPALEMAHAFAGAKRWARDHPGGRILLGLSGRGDKDMPTLAKHPPAGRRS
mgnify:CR=1 FL=1